MSAKLLVVDTIHQFAGLAGDDENSAGAALQAAKPLQEALAHGIAIVVIRHERKSGGGMSSTPVAAARLSAEQ